MWHNLSLRVLVIVLFLGTILRLPQFSFPLGGSNGFRKTQTASVAREFHREGIDLLSYPLKVFGSAEGVPFEMPIFQAGAALLQHIGFDSDSSGQILAFCMFQISAILTWILATRWFSKQIAITSTILFQFVPYSLEWGSAYLIESTALAFSLAVVLFLDNWYRGGNITNVFWSGVFSVLAFLTKITTPIGWFFGALVYFYMHYSVDKWSLRSFTRLWPIASAGSIGLLSGILWAGYADAIKGKHPATELFQSSRLNEWNFGTLEQRFDPKIYIGFAERIGLEVMGFTLLLLPVALILARRDRSIQAAAALIAIGSFGPLVFLNLFRHDYYFLANLPAFVILSSWVLSVIFVHLTGKFSMAIASGSVIVLLFTVMTSTLGLSSVRSAFVAPQPNPLVGVVSQFTTYQSNLVLVGCSWDPSILYGSDRRGLMIVDHGENSLERLWSVEKIEDYDYLVFCGEKKPWFPGVVEIESVYLDTIYSIG
jgi:hypothetical protein